LTGDQHTDHISNGQRVSRHSLPTLLYFLFYSQVVLIFNGVRECLSISPPHIFFNSNKRSDSQAPLKEKLNKRVILCRPANGTLAFALPIAIGTQANPSAKAKEPFLPTHRQTIISETINFRILTD